MLTEELAEEALVRADLWISREGGALAGAPGAQRGARGGREESAGGGAASATLAEGATGRVAKEHRIVRLDRRVAFGADVEAGSEA